MYTYIKKQIPGYYIDVTEQVDSTQWAGQIGSSYNDFLENKWILLTEEQISFHNENPTASVEEVLNCQSTPVPERTLEEAKIQKMFAIGQYDSSEAVNSFDIIFGGNTITVWITPDQRANYKNSLDSAELLGLDEVHPVFNGIQFTLPTQTAKMALAQIQIYADRCFIVTETHKTNVSALNTIEAVDNYNNETNYPERLVFNLDAA